MARRMNECFATRSASASVGHSRRADLPTTNADAEPVRVGVGALLRCVTTAAMSMGGSTVVGTIAYCGWEAGAAAWRLAAPGVEGRRSLLDVVDGRRWYAAGGGASTEPCMQRRWQRLDSELRGRRQGFTRTSGRCAARGRSRGAAQALSRRVPRAAHYRGRFEHRERRGSRRRPNTHQCGAEDEVSAVDFAKCGLPLLAGVDAAVGVHSLPMACVTLTPREAAVWPPTPSPMRHAREPLNSVAA